MTRIRVTKGEFVACNMKMFELALKPVAKQVCEAILHDQMVRIDEICAAVLKECDKDKDGLISKEELCEHFFQTVRTHCFMTPQNLKIINDTVAAAVIEYGPKLVASLNKIGLKRQREECTCTVM